MSVYTVTLKDNDGFELSCDQVYGLSEAKRHAKYLLSHAKYILSDAETTHADLGTLKAEIENGAGVCVWDRSS